MAEPVTMPDEEVAGLLIPADLAVQIISAFRELYPEVTANKDDDTAVRHVLIWFITSSMETAANRKAQSALDATMEQLRTGAELRSQERRAAIHAAAGRIKEKPVPTEGA